MESHSRSAWASKIAIIKTTIGTTKGRMQMFKKPIKLSLLGLFLAVYSGLAAAAPDTPVTVPASSSASSNSSTEAAAATPAPAATASTKESVQQPAVSPQVENLKESALTLNRDLLILEEELLYPPSNQIAVYLSMDIGQFFNLDAVKVEIDNKLVASELYTDKQINALIRGGVQRLYVGNLKAGEHEVAAFFTGRGPQQDYKRGAKLTVNKTQSPMVLELKIVDSTAQLQPTFNIKEWKSE